MKNMSNHLLFVA